jgi:hypothetical protein
MLGHQCHIAATGASVLLEVAAISKRLVRLQHCGTMSPHAHALRPLCFGRSRAQIPNQRAAALKFSNEPDRNMFFW